MRYSRMAEHEVDVPTSGYEVFDPIDYVVADNVVDLREARLRRLQEQRQQGRHDVEVLEEDSRLQARSIAREERCERLRIKREERERRDAQRLAKCPACHWGLFLLTILLTVLSVPIVYSASTAIALDHHDNADYFFLRQVGYVAVGITLFLLVSRFNAKQIRASVWLLYFGSLLGLIATDFTPLGHSLGGVERWMKVGPITFQMSELAKVALIGVLADFWSRAARPAQNSLWPWFFAAALTLPLSGWSSRSHTFRRLRCSWCFRSPSRFSPMCRSSKSSRSGLCWEYSGSRCWLSASSMDCPVSSPIRLNV
jgi:hypothetical protein